MPEMQSPYQRIYLCRLIINKGNSVALCYLPIPPGFQHLACYRGLVVTPCAYRDGTFPDKNRCIWMDELLRERAMPSLPGKAILGNLV